MLENAGPGPKRMAADVDLPAGRHRLQMVYAIQANPTRNPNFFRLSLLAGDRLVRVLVLPRKHRPDGEEKVARMDVTLRAPTRLRLEFQLEGPGRVAIHKLDFLPAPADDLPRDPAFLFVNPDRGLTSERIIHQGLSSIAAALESRGFASHAAITSTTGDQELLEAVSRHGYRYVGFYTTSDDGVLATVRALAAAVKARRPDTVTIAGGVHASLDPEDLLNRIPEMDLVARGEGEWTCCELAEGRPWGEILGLSWRQDGRVVHNPERPRLTAGEMLSPSRYNYLNPDWSAHSLSTSRGCPHQCHFCIGHEIFGRTIRFRPLEQIDAELQALYEKGDHSLVVSINDDMFNMRRDRTLALMEIFRKYPFFYFPRGMRADRLDAETARAMREAGVVGTSIGIECADDEALKAMKKGETLAQIVQGMKHLQDNGIPIVGQFMIGNIGDTLETVKKTIAFIQEHQIKDINISCAIPFPGTALRRWVVENKRLFPQPVHTLADVTNGNTTIYFDTPHFPLEDRIKAVELVAAAGLYTRACS
jgi:radical SAM superfamily enzyme YgiQ (UPF0313 family)